MKKRIVGASLLAAAALSLSACKSSSNTIDLQGAGSTFVNPVMTRWVQGDLPPEISTS